MKKSARASLFGLLIGLGVILTVVLLLWWQIGPRTTDPYLKMRLEWQREMLGRYGENDIEKMAVFNLTNIYVRGTAISDLPRKLTGLIPGNWDDKEKADYWRTIYLMAKAENDEGESSRAVKTIDLGLLFHSYRLKQKINSSFKLLKGKIEKDGAIWLLHVHTVGNDGAYIELRNIGLPPINVNEIKIIYFDNKQDVRRMATDFYLDDGNIELTNLAGEILGIAIKARNPAVETDMSPAIIYLIDEANLRSLVE